jgi:predicted RNA binding protein YcfA (HicA-like mRNA interferase family)
MSKLPRMSGKEIVKALERLGFIQIRQRGSHVSLKKVSEKGVIGCVVPLHKEVAYGTLKGILRQAHLSEEEFMENIN